MKICQFLQENLRFLQENPMIFVEKSTLTFVTIATDTRLSTQNQFFFFFFF